MNNKTKSISIERTIKIFISSTCGIPKYDNVREQLKSHLEETGIFTVYTFESNGPATFSAGFDYRTALKDCDVCIFLIDNEDGYKNGVQEEINIVKNNNIRSLYYFCDENSTNKTALQQSLEGAEYSKNKTVHSFEELRVAGVKALIDDILNVYHYYCKGYIAELSNDTDYSHEFTVSDISQKQTPIIPKIVLSEVDSCTQYILKFATKHSWLNSVGYSHGSSDIDKWCYEFLPVLFEGKSIRQFNTSLFLNALKEYQNENYHELVELRWGAIQSYYLGNLEDAISKLEKALKFAKDNNHESWIINDILIDLRNLQRNFSVLKNYYPEAEAQKQINESIDNIYYPTMDRLRDSLHEKYINDIYKNKLKSPLSVSFGNNVKELAELLSSIYIVAMYNGSLTYILLMNNEIKQFLFYLNSKYDNWDFKLNYYKFAILSNDDKEIKGIQEVYPEILNKMSADDADEIMSSCNKFPIKEYKLEKQLKAFGLVGYYLKDESFERYQQVLISELGNLLNDSSDYGTFILLKSSVFSALSGIAERLSQEVLSKICCMILQTKLPIIYRDVFGIIERYISLVEMDKNSAKQLITQIIEIINSDNGRKYILEYPYFLSQLRKQNRELTKELDQMIRIYLPEFYKINYKLDTSENINRDYPLIMKEYINEIKFNNRNQGENGVFVGHPFRYHAILRKMLVTSNYVCNDLPLMKDLIHRMSDTLIYSKEDVETKLDAISVLICVIVKYPDIYLENIEVYKTILKNQEHIIETTNLSIFSNIDTLGLRIGLQFLFTAMGKENSSEIFKLLIRIQSNEVTILFISRLLKEYLEITDSVYLSSNLENIFLQNILQWLQLENTAIRWYSTNILLLLSKSSNNQDLINHKIIELMDCDNTSIKILILEKIRYIVSIPKDIRDYVISKCETDSNYLVRKKLKHL